MPDLDNQDILAKDLAFDTIITPQQNLKQDIKQDSAPQIFNDSKETSIRLTKLPEHETDFAKSWFYGLQKEFVSDEIILEYNIYLQVLDELKEEKIKLPEGFSGKVLAIDLHTFVLKDFNKHKMWPDVKNNMYHRAFYSHCLKRGINKLRDGEYTGPDGHTSKYPEIADLIENRINEVYFEKLVKDQLNP